MSVFLSAAELLTEAQRGNATAAAALWRRIDAGDVPDVIALTWVRDVAAQVVAKVLANDVPSNRVRERAHAALGLEGRIDKNADLARLVAMSPDSSVRKLAEIAPLVVEVGKDSPRQLEQKFRDLRKKAKKAKK